MGDRGQRTAGLRFNFYGVERGLLGQPAGNRLPADLAVDRGFDDLLRLEVPAAFHVEAFAVTSRERAGGDLQAGPIEPALC